MVRSCPICGSGRENAEIFMQRNIDAEKLSSFSYASRKLPEYMCHEMLRCKGCDLVYVAEPPADDELADAYHVADYDSSEEANDAAAAYIKAIQPALNRLHQKKDALEIGTGTGVFLEELKRDGFTRLVGIEPSSSAIDAAPKHRKDWILEGIFREEDHQASSFDLICCFMTMEHVPDPKLISDAAFRLLRPGGAFVIIVHNYRSAVNRILGKRSPIIDVEHMQLFSPGSISRLFELGGYQHVSVKAFVNRYSLLYWFRLMPVPAPAKALATKLLSASGMGNAKIGMNVGNTIAYGFKPNETLGTDGS